MKRIISLLVVLAAICVSASALVYAMPFTDVSEGTEEYSAIEKLWSYGYVSGTAENTFSPSARLTRAELVKIVNNVFSYTQCAENPFSDVSEDDWFYTEIKKAVQAGYISGMGDGRFCPDDNVTREQVCVIINNILNMEMLPIEVNITDAVSAWAADSVKKAVAMGLASTDSLGRFRATQDITRGEAAVILAKCTVDKPAVIEPINLEDLADSVLEERMTNIIEKINDKVIPLCYLEEQKQVALSIAESMGKYLKDRSFDYKNAKDETFEIYASMENRDDRLAFQNMITSNMSLDDLLILYDFFFPEEDK